jgi:hypothetical protein
LTGRELHAAHGRRDHVTRAKDTRAYVDRARAVTTAASFTDMGDPATTCFAESTPGTPSRWTGSAACSVSETDPETDPGTDHAASALAR